MSERISTQLRQISKAQPVVALVFVVALLSVLTGIVNLDRDPTGPLAQTVPAAVHDTVGFTGALTGFLMVGSAFTLRSGLKFGWYTTMVLLPITAAQGLLQSSIYSVPLIILSIVAIPLLWLTRNQFSKELSLTTTQMAAASALIGVQFYGTFGAFAIRDDFDGINSLLDAFYFTLITSSTVGYGDIVAQTEYARLFTMTVVVLGVASFGIAIGALVGPAIQHRIQKTLGKMTDSQLQLLDNHILVLGYGELTEPIIEELGRNNIQLAVIAADRDACDRFIKRDLIAIHANPSDEDSLRRAKITQAQAVVIATNNDAEDALAILTARQLNPDIRIVASATDKENTGKLKRAGADIVISPAVMGGNLLVQSAISAEPSPLLEELTIVDNSEDQ